MPELWQKNQGARMKNVYFFVALLLIGVLACVVLDMQRNIASSSPTAIDSRREGESGPALDLTWPSGTGDALQITGPNEMVDDATWLFSHEYSVPGGF